MPSDSEIAAMDRNDFIGFCTNTAGQPLQPTQIGEESKMTRGDVRISVARATNNENNSLVRAHHLDTRLSGATNFADTRKNDIVSKPNLTGDHNVVNVKKGEPSLCEQTMLNDTKKNCYKLITKYSTRNIFLKTPHQGHTTMSRNVACDNVPLDPIGGERSSKHSEIKQAVERLLGDEGPSRISTNNTKTCYTLQKRSDRPAEGEKNENLMITHDDIHKTSKACIIQDEKAERDTTSSINYYTSETCKGSKYFYRPIVAQDRTSGKGELDNKLADDDPHAPTNKVQLCSSKPYLTNDDLLLSIDELSKRIQQRLDKELLSLQSMLRKSDQEKGSTVQPHSSRELDPNTSDDAEYIFFADTKVIYEDQGAMVFDQAKQKRFISARNNYSSVPSSKPPFRAFHSSNNNFSSARPPADKADTQSLKDNDPMYYFSGLNGIDPAAHDLTKNSSVAAVHTTNEVLKTRQAYDALYNENSLKASIGIYETIKFSLYKHKNLSKATTTTLSKVRLYVSAKFNMPTFSKSASGEANIADAGLHASKDLTDKVADDDPNRLIVGYSVFRAAKAVLRKLANNITVNPAQGPKLLSTKIEEDGKIKHIMSDKKLSSSCDNIGSLVNVDSTVAIIVKPHQVLKSNHRFVVHSKSISSRCNRRIEPLFRHSNAIVNVIHEVREIIALLQVLGKNNPWLLPTSFVMKILFH